MLPRPLSNSQSDVIIPSPSIAASSPSPSPSLAPWNLLALRWRHNGHDSISDHQPRHRLLNRLFGCRSKKTSKLRVTGLCAGKSPGTGEFPAQMASNAENASIWWRHHVEICHKTSNGLMNRGTSHQIYLQFILFCFYIEHRLLQSIYQPPLTLLIKMTSNMMHPGH